MRTCTSPSAASRPCQAAKLRRPRWVGHEVALLRWVLRWVGCGVALLVGGPLFSWSGFRLLPLLGARGRVWWLQVQVLLEGR